MFIIGWYLSLLGTFIPLESMHLVIHNFIHKRFMGLVQIVITYFIFLKEILMSTDDECEIMQELSVMKMSERSNKIDWEQLIRAS